MKTGDKESCGHKGKWAGGGQNVFNAGNAIIIISTAVCGECGQSVLSINPLQLTQKKMEKEIVTSASPLPPIEKH